MAVVKMTDKQKRFCDEYLIDCNATRAYKMAYPRVKSDNVASASGTRLLGNVKVKTYIQEQLDKINSEKIADVKEMQEKLTEIIRQSLDEEVIVIEGVGDGCSEARTMTKKPSTKDVISAITTLGKMQGAFVEKVEQQVDMELNIKIDYGDEDDEEKT